MFWRVCLLIKSTVAVSKIGDYMRKCFFVLIGIIVLLCFIFQIYPKNKMPKLIGEISFDSNYKGEPIVYILENDNYVPFIVVTNNYNGNTLLLRRDILPTACRVNDYSGYYKDSVIDKFLNFEYLSTLSSINNSIILSSISITSESALGVSGSEVENIDRKVFLLSLYEIGINTSINAGAEGVPMEYFEKIKNRIAYTDGVARSWWLRSPNTYYFSCVYGVGANGRIGNGNAFDENGIRPALCVPSTLPISVREDISENNSVYVL